MAPICRWIAVISILLISSYASAQTKIPRLVLVVSIDALHPEALQRASIPTIRGLMQKGAHSLDGRSTGLIFRYGCGQTIPKQALWSDRFEANC